MRRVATALIAVLLPLSALAALRGTTGSAGTSGTATSNTLTYSGTAIQTGDCEALITGYSPGGSTSLTDPSGWTSGSTVGISDRVINGTVFHVAFKIAGVGDTGTPSYTTTDAGAYGGYWNQQLRVYYGRENSSVSTCFTPVSVTTAGTSGNTPYAYSLTGLTATAGADILVANLLTLGSFDSGTTYSASISSYANTLSTNFNASASYPLVSLDYVDNPGGATGTLSESITATNVTTLAPAAFVISIPASGGAPTAPPPQPSPFAIGASLLPRGVDLASFAH